MAKFHTPSEATRAMVSAMAVNGITQEAMAESLGITRVTLMKHYRDEVLLGKQRANARVCDSLFKMAVSGRYPAATIFWAKAQMGWSELSRIDLTSAEQPKEVVVRFADEQVSDILAPGEASGPD